MPFLNILGASLESVCSFQSMKGPVKLNNLFLKYFVVSPGLIRRDTEQIENEAFTSNPIVSFKQ